MFFNVKCLQTRPIENRKALSWFKLNLKPHNNDRKITVNNQKLLEAIIQTRHEKAKEKGIVLMISFFNHEIHL